MTKTFSLIEGHPLAFGVDVPEAFDTHQSIRLSSDGLGIESMQSKETTSYLKRSIIIGGAFTISPDLALGISGSLVNETRKGTSGVSGTVIDKAKVISRDPTKKYRITTVDQITGDLWSLWFKLATLYRLSSQTSLGFFVAHAESVHRKFSSDYQFSYYEINGSPNAEGSVPSKSNGIVEVSSKALPKIYYGPWQARIGVKHELTSGTLIAMDLQYYLPQKTSDDPPHGLHPVWDVALGFESPMGQSYLVRGGLYTSFDVRKGPFNAETASYRDSNIDDYGLTLSGSSIEGESEYSLTTTLFRGSGRGSPLSVGDLSPVRSISRWGVELSLGLSTRI